MFTKNYQYSVVQFFFITILFICLSQNSYGKIFKTDGTVADKTIVVQDYGWFSSNIGSRGILKDVKLINKSDQTFKNIDIVVELYNRNNVFLGSVKGTIKNTILAGEVKTFERVKLGLLHTSFQKSIARVVRTDSVETAGSDVLPKDLILVKDWEWLGNQFGTDGILKQIRIENKSNKNYKNIKLIMISRLGRQTSNSDKEEYITNFLIRDTLLANSTSTYTNINVGFRHPSSTQFNISVSNAQEITDKELRYLTQKKQKKKKYKEVSRDQHETADQAEDSVNSPTKKQEQLSSGDYELAIPEYDIQVEDFNWGSGIPGSQGIIRELTLRNNSRFTYSKVDIEVEFLSSTGIHIASNDLTLTEELPANSVKTYKNLNLGVIVVLPNKKHMKITVRDATPEDKIQ